MCVVDIFPGNGRYQRNLRSRFAVVLFASSCCDPVGQVFLELVDAFWPGERFVEAEERQNHVRFLHFQVLIQAAKVQRPRHQRDFVRRPSHVADDELMLGKVAMQHGFKMAEMLHPFGQRVADENNAIALFQRELWHRVGSGRRGQRHSADRCPKKREPQHPKAAKWGTGVR